MKRLFLLWMLVLAGTASSQTGSSSSTPFAATPAAEFRLSNGMALIVKPDRRAPTAVHMLWLRVGSIDEVDGTSGVAHVQEHMMFKGTPTLAPGLFSRRVAALGGRENAFTARDYTGYYQQIPSSALEEVMRLEADTFAHNQWSDDEFRKEIEVVKEERRMRTEDNPRAQLYEQLSAVGFTASPYRRPIVGWMNDLDAMTPGDVRDFYRRWYVPGNAAVVVAGDVDVQQVRQWAEKYYGGIPAAEPPPRKPRLEPAQRGMRSLTLKAPAEQAYVALSFKMPTLAPTGLRAETATPQDRDALALTMLAAVLDGHRGARMERALTQGPDRIALSAGAGGGLWGRGPQTFVLDGVPAPGKTVQQLSTALRAEVQRVAREGVTDTELQRVKVQWAAGEVYRLDSVFNQARSLGANWALGLPLEPQEQLLAQLRTVTAEQVRDVAARYFGDDELTVAELHPLPVDPARKRRSLPAGAREEE